MYEYETFKIVLYLFFRYSAGSYIDALFHVIHQATLGHQKSHIST